MGILGLAEVYRLVRHSEIGQHEALVDGDVVRRQGEARPSRSRATSACTWVTFGKWPKRRVLSGPVSFLPQLESSVSPGRVVRKVLRFMRDAFGV